MWLVVIVSIICGAIYGWAAVFQKDELNKPAILRSGVVMFFAAFGGFLIPLAVGYRASGWLGLGVALGVFIVSGFIVNMRTQRRIWRRLIEVEKSEREN